MRGVFLCVLACASQGAFADALEDARRLSASPDTPAFGLGFRDHLHGSAGAEIPVLVNGSEGGWAFHIPAMVELANDQNDPTPNNYWRGLLGLELAYRFHPGARWAGTPSLGLRLQHESDHETRHTSRDEGTPFGFYQLNSLGVEGDLPLPFHHQRITATAVIRLHLATCTAEVSICGTAVGGQGARTVEGIAELVWDGSVEEPPPGAWRPVVSLFADGLVPSGLALEEHRFVANAGAWAHLAHSGRFELFCLGWLGSDVGYLRHRRVKELGVGIRWTP